MKNMNKISWSLSKWCSSHCRKAIYLYSWTIYEIKIKDFLELEKPTQIDGIEIHDVMKVFSGDGQARQFEDGQQKGRQL